MRAKLFRLLLLAALILLAVFAWRQYEAQQQAAQLFTGTVEVTKADIAAKTSGYLRQLTLQEGDSLTQGEAVAQLDRKDLQAALLRDQAAYAAAQTKLQKLINGSRSEELRAAAARTAAASAAWDKAARDSHRMQQLLASGAVAQSAADDAQSAEDTTAAQLAAARADELLLINGTRAEDLQSAREEVSQAQAVLAMSQSMTEDLTLYSPLSGLVLSKNFESGEYVAAGAAIATVADLSDCWVRVYVSSAELGRLHAGQSASVRIDAAPGRIFTGHIREIRDTAEYTPRQSITKNERANLVFAVKVAIDNEDGILKPGMPADVSFDA